MRFAGTWFLIVGALTIVGIYRFGVRPRTARQWTLVAITIAFAAWVLQMMVSLR